MMNHKWLSALLTFSLLGFLWPVASFAAPPTLSATTVYWTSGNIVSSAKDTTAKLGATIDTDGGQTITERGIVWSISDTTPTIAEGGTKAIGTGTATGVYFVNATGLTKASHIYFSGYAINAGGTSYSAPADFWTEPDAVAAPTVTAPSGTNYFNLTVNYTKPANADGVLVVVRQSYAPTKAPYDGTVYAANARIGDGDTTVPGCTLFCEYVVADDTISGPRSVTVTGLKANTKHYFVVYAYKGSGTGISGINYVQTITAAGPTTTDAVPLAGRSHNEQWVTTGGIETSADCAKCHNRHHTAQPLVPTGIDMYTKCFACHQAGGAADPKINIGLHLADGSVDCGTCHSMHSFRTEELYSKNHAGVWGFNRSFVRANMSKLMNPAEYPPPAGGGTTTALDNTVFQDRTTDFAFALADPDPDTGKYNGVCQTCHTIANHHRQTTTDNHNIGLDCASCHAHKQADEYNAFQGGGHDASQFAWSASCGAVNCHNQAANPDVANDIHGNGTTATCTLCHLTSSGGSGTTKVGARGDGDATLGNSAAPHAGVTCLTCHNAADPDVNGDDALDSYGAIHHDTELAINNSCTTCHLAGGYDHTALVANEAAGVNTLYGCATCHTGTAASGDVPPTNLTDPMVHDACRTCHTFRPAPNMDGDLRTLATASKGVPAGQLPTGPTPLGGADGGGACVACHSNGTVDSYHHTNANTSIGNCDWCHEDPRLTAPQSGFTKPPELTPSRVPTQLFCIECHMAPLNHNGGGTNGVPTAASAGTISNTRVTAWASSTMTIYAFNQGSDARKTATSWTTAYPRTTVHQVPNTAAQIDNWGICLGCHDGTANRVAAGAAQVNPIHAMPTTISPLGDYCLTSDVPGNSGGLIGKAMYLPGRSSYNNISNVNYYGDYFKPRATRPRTTQNIRNVTWNITERCGDMISGTYSRAWQLNTNARSAGRTMYGTSSTYSTITIPNPWGAGSTFQNYYVQNWPLGQDSTVLGDNNGPDAPTGIPTFEVTRPITSSTDQIAIDGDDVKVTSATWDGATLTVVATNTDGCAALNLIYPSGGSQVATFSGAGPCTANYSLGNLGAGTKVDVTTDNTTGLSVIGYPITQP